MLTGTMKPDTQKEIVTRYLACRPPQSIGEVAAATDILEPNIRRILGQGEKRGDFKRVGRGVYTLQTADGAVSAYIQCGEAQKEMPGLAEAGMKFDLVFLDIPYYSRALVGGNRGIKQYDFITPADFHKMCVAAGKLLRTDNSPLYVMLSGAPTAQTDMGKYAGAVTAAGLKLVGEGSYTKTFADGRPVTNVRGVQAAPERLLLYSRSGEVDGEHCIDFVCRRPKGYQTEKAKFLLRKIIAQSTKIGGWVLDGCGGSGVTAEQAVLTGRNVYIIEKILAVVEELIVPRTMRAIATYNLIGE